MQLHSYYSIECANCGKTVETVGASVNCWNCGTLLVVESWQAKHTMTAAGHLVENSTLEKKKP